MKFVVDEPWYLRTYEDVRIAKMSATDHFVRHGYREGRMPRKLRAEQYERLLWSAEWRNGYVRLTSICDDINEPYDERTYAEWVLAMWAAGSGRWTDTYRLLRPRLKGGYALPGHAGGLLLLGLAAARLQQHDDAIHASRLLRENYDPISTSIVRHQVSLTAGNLAREFGCARNPWSTLNELFDGAGLVPIMPATTNKQLCSYNTNFEWLGTTTTPKSSAVEGPLVTVIVPARNAEATVRGALLSVINQTWRNIQIIFVDDCSDDATAAVASDLLEHSTLPIGKSAIVLKNSLSVGPYACRNSALHLATGQFITVHDADDWSHPEKIRIQVGVLLDNPKAKASISHWMRVSDSLEPVAWHPEASCVHRNLSSLMIPEVVLAKHGGWDEVAFGADSEFLERLYRIYGSTSILDAMPGTPLSLALSRKNSLTRSETSRASQRLGGPRVEYANAYRRWHRTVPPTHLHMPQSNGLRPFLTPHVMAVRFEAVEQYNEFDLVEQCELWDEAWYLAAYPDTADFGAPLVEHYLTHGSIEGRDPSPIFSTTGYAYSQKIGYKIINPLVHYINNRQTQEYSVLNGILGGRRFNSDRPTLMIVGHLCGEFIFGAERCLLSICEVLRENYNLVACLPSAGNFSYLESLLLHVCKLHIFPYSWWNVQRSENMQTVSIFSDLLVKYGVRAMHVNTLTLKAPCIAATACNVPVVMHAHEHPAANAGLLDGLNATSLQILAHARLYASVVISPSEYVTKGFVESDSNIAVRTVNNHVNDIDSFGDVPRAFSKPSQLRVGMISNNHPYKGINDFERVVRSVSRRLGVGHKQRLIYFSSYGPRSDASALVQERLSMAKLNCHVSFHDYQADVRTALSELDVVLWLPNTQESFGLIVAEAMACGRLVIAYNNGAINELLQSGVHGYIAAQSDTEQVADLIMKVLDDRHGHTKICHAAQSRAARRFSKVNFAQSIMDVYADVLRDSWRASIRIGHSGV